MARLGYPVTVIGYLFCVDGFLKRLAAIRPFRVLTRGLATPEVATGGIAETIGDEDVPIAPDGDDAVIGSDVVSIELFGKVGDSMNRTEKGLN